MNKLISVFVNNGDCEVCIILSNDDNDNDHSKKIDSDSLSKINYNGNRYHTTYSSTSNPYSSKSE